MRFTTSVLTSSFIFPVAIHWRAQRNSIGGRVVRGHGIFADEIGNLIPQQRLHGPVLKHVECMLRHVSFRLNETLLVTSSGIL